MRGTCLPVDTDTRLTAMSQEPVAATAEAEAARIATELDALQELSQLPIGEHHARLESAHRLLDELLRGDGPA